MQGSVYQQRFIPYNIYIYIYTFFFKFYIIYIYEYKYIFVFKNQIGELHHVLAENHFHKGVLKLAVSGRLTEGGGFQIVEPLRDNFFQSLQKLPLYDKKKILGPKNKNKNGWEQARARSHTHTHTYIYIYMNTHIQTYKHTVIYIYIYIYECRNLRPIVCFSVTKWKFSVLRTQIFFVKDI